MRFPLRPALPAALLAAVAFAHAAAPDPVFDIADAGAKRRFELALDETEATRPDGRSAAAAIHGTPAGLADLRRHAIAAEAADGGRHDLVLYEAGKARHRATRRVLTRKVLVRPGPGFDADRTLRETGAVHLETPGYAPDAVILTFSEPGAALTQATALRQRAGVRSAEPLLARRHEKRLIPDDPFFSYNAANPGYQWHLRNTGQYPGTTGIDANLTGVWDAYAGDGVRIGIVDDGLETAHPDLAPNADTANDHDWNDATPDDPTGNAISDTHGTSCAGVAGARGSNATGVSGAAPRATLVGLRLIAGNASDADEAAALTWKNDIIQIYSNSWGPADDGADLRDAGPLVKQALAHGVATGRGGRGSIWLWAAGNGGDVDDNSNYDGYANSIHTLAIGAVNDDGVRSAYSEPGASVLVCAPSSDTTGDHRDITTTTTNGGYTHQFGGTSAATPLAAGVVALLLQSNPNLGWRDVKEILLRSATKTDPAHSDWSDNGAGYHFNHHYGAGLINAQAAVALADGWTPLGPQTTHQSSLTALSAAIPDNSATGLTRSFGVPAEVAMRVEHATLQVTATHGRRGDLEITLTSPAGTASKLLLSHPADSNLNLDWTFSSLRHWGETAAGTWTMKIADRVGGSAGTLTSATLTLYGSNSASPTSPPAITSPLAAGGNVDSSFQYTITATHNPQTFSASGLPPGLSLSADGLISGIPSAAGTFQVLLGATNALGTGTATLTLTIGPRLPTPPVITSAASATAVRDVPFSYQITATNMPASYAAAGLPTGLSVNPATGTITGAPTVTGLFDVSLTATNADGSGSLALALTVTTEISALAQALDSPHLAFTTGGDLPWSTTTTTTHDGADAAHSGAITHNQQTWLETAVTGPAYLSFWFQLSSERDFDFFRFFINGESLWESSGTHNWRRLGFFVPPGIHTARWTYTKDDSQSDGSDRLWVDQVAVHPEQAFLAEVVDNPALTWRQSGSGTWVMQDLRSHDGTDAFISPVFLNHGRSSAIETTVTGPGTVTFWWTVSSEQDRDFFRFEMDSGIRAQISGNNGGNNIPWASQSLAIPAGVHTLRWRYIKDEAGSDGLDAGWLDAISYTTDFATGPPYNQWLAAAFPAAVLGNAEITGPNADPDGDLRDNLMEYAFGGSPAAPDQTAPITIQPTAGETIFSYVTDSAKADLLITPELSADLLTWQTATAELFATEGTLRTWQVRVPRTAGSGFVRLRASLADP
jgi:kexin